MRVTLVQTGAHVEWQKGEIIVVQVVAERDEVGVYECETLDTHPDPVKVAEEHTRHLEAQATSHAEELQSVHARHAMEIQKLTSTFSVPVEPEPVGGTDISTEK